MDQKKIERINALARKSRESGLTDAEQAEQQLLRAEYIAAYKRNLTATLERTVIVDAAGNRRKVQKKKQE